MKPKAEGKPERPKSPARVGVFLRLAPEQREQMLERAALEDMPFCTWLKRCALKELRRPFSL